MSIYDISEADEASITKSQALSALRSTYIDNGPGGMTDMYIRAAWTKGATAYETNFAVSNAFPHRRMKLLADVYDAILRSGKDYLADRCIGYAWSESIPQVEIDATVANALEARDIASRINQSLGVVAYSGLALN